MLLASGGTSVYGQDDELTDLEETLRQVDAPYAEAYLRPLTDALGVDLNAGLFQDAHIKRLGFSLYVGIEAAAVWLPPSALRFDLDYNGTVDLNDFDDDFDFDFVDLEGPVPATISVRDAPTIFGSEEPVGSAVDLQFDTTVTFIGLDLPVLVDTTLDETIGGLVETDVAPFGVPHVRLGAVLGTEVVLRWLPEIDVPSLGRVGLVGYGVRHSLSQYLPLLPIDLAAQVMWQRVDIATDRNPDLMAARTFSASVQASYRWRMLVVYGGLQTEETRIDYAYERIFEFDDEPDRVVPVRFRQHGAVTSRGVLGLGLQLGVLRLGGSAAFTNTDLTAVTTSLGVGF